MRLFVDQLVETVDAYNEERISLDQFEDWFRTNSRGMFAESPEVLGACLAIDAAFSEFRYGTTKVLDLREGVASAIRPFSQKNTFLCPPWNRGKEVAAQSRSTAKNEILKDDETLKAMPNPTSNVPALSPACALSA